MSHQYGILTEAGARKLAFPHLARCVVAYTPGQHERAGSHTREIFFRGKRLGGILRLDEEGVLPLAVSAASLEDRALEAMAALVRCALDAALLGDTYSVVVHDGLVGIGDDSMPDLVTLSRTSASGVETVRIHPGQSGSAVPGPAWEIQVASWDDGGREYPGGPDVVIYRVEQAWAAAAEQAVLWIHRQSIAAAFSLRADDEPGGEDSAGAASGKPALRSGPVPLTIRGWRGSPAPAVVQGVLHPGRTIRGIGVEVLEVLAGPWEGDPPTLLELVRDASEREIFYHHQLFSSGGVNLVAMGEERARALLANGGEMLAVRGALGELHYKKPIRLDGVYRLPLRMEVARSALALMEACPTLFPGLFPVE